jgi:hypothetical protein
LIVAGTYQTFRFTVNQHFVLIANGEHTTEVNWMCSQRFKRFAEARSCEATLARVQGSKGCGVVLTAKDGFLQEMSMFSL